MKEEGSVSVKVIGIGYIQSSIYAAWQVKVNS